jgi:Ras-related protein Rab-6A
MNAAAAHRVVLLGESCVGKTCLLHQYIYGTADPEHQPTVGVDFFAKTIKKPMGPVRFQIWDTAGQEKFHSMITSYIRNTTIVILVFDITSRESFDQLDAWLKIVLDLANPVFFVVGNKDDLASQRKVSAEDGEKWAGLHDAKYFETSATMPHNVTELFAAVTDVPVPSPQVVGERPAEVVAIEKPAAQAAGSCC